jgi:RNA polymerase sigma-70 factor (ECF subfamily)
LYPPDEIAAQKDFVLIRSQRDEGAFNRLYDIYSPILYRVCILILKDESEAQEALQDAFVHLWERPEGFDPARGKLFTWLCLVTRSKAIDRLRSMARRGKKVTPTANGDLEHLLGSNLASGPDALEDSVQDARREAVRGLLRRLKPGQAEVLWLSYFEQLSQKEIAQRLGKPLGTVKSLMRAATRKLSAVVPPEMKAWL